jgi:hypothetical protein
MPDLENKVNDTGPRVTSIIAGRGIVLNSSIGEDDLALEALGYKPEFRRCFPTVHIDTFG